MASPSKLISKLACISPRRPISPRTPTNLTVRKLEQRNHLSPFNIDTPNREMILKHGLPTKRRDLLGSGGFGTVYKASYKGDQVAAKIVQKRRGSAAIIDSEKHASHLRHSNIVKVLSIEEGAALSLITMELCGTTLQDCLEDGPLAKEERVRICRDIAYALQFCHNAGVIHADVKPKNILIADNGQPKLTDFGSSVLMGQTSSHPNLRCTPGYAAPEVLQGYSPTATADIYSLGIVAWQMLSRKVPFAGLHPHVIIYLSVKGRRPEDEDISDDFFGKYKKLYREMWLQDSDSRPALAVVINKLGELII